MAKTITLNSQQTVWVTTYFGGQEHGVCFDISMQLDDETQVTRTFDLTQLRQILMVDGHVRGLMKPSFDGEISEDHSEMAKIVNSLGTRDDRIMEMFEAGQTRHEIADALDMNYQTVCTIIRKYS